MTISRLTIVLASAIFLSGLCLGALMSGHGCTHSVPVSTVIRSDTVTVMLPAVHDTLRAHTVVTRYFSDTLHDTVGTHVDTVIQRDSSYAYGFHLVAPDSAKIASTVVIHGLLRIPDNDIRNEITYTPASRKTITNNITNTVLVKPSWWSGAKTDIEWCGVGIGIGAIGTAILMLK